MSARDRSVTEPASFASQEDPDPAVVDIEEAEALEAEGSRQGIGRRADRAPADASSLVAGVIVWRVCVQLVPLIAGIPLLGALRRAPEAA